MELQIDIIHPTCSYSRRQSRQNLCIKRFLNEAEDRNTIQRIAVLKWAIAYDTQTKIWLMRIASFYKHPGNSI